MGSPGGRAACWDLTNHTVNFHGIIMNYGALIQFMGFHLIGDLASGYLT